MYDLSVTYNLIFFAACVALCVVWLFLTIDIIAARKPKKALKAACMTCGIIGLVLSVLFAAVIIGFAAGLMTVEGTSVVIASLKIPAIAEFALLFTYYITYGFTGLFFLLSLLLVIFACIRKERIAAQSEVAATADLQIADEKEETPAEKQGESIPAEKTGEEKKDFAMTDVRSIMDEISGLVDSLDFPLDDEQSETQDNNISEEEPEPEAQYDASEEEADDTADEETDGFVSDEAEETDISDELEETDNRPADIDETDEETIDEAAEVEEDELPQENEQEIAAMTAEKVKTDFKRKAAQREIDDFKEVGKERREAPHAGTRTIVRAASDEAAREVRPMESGLPIKKRHVLLNRRNVVNMFSDYLKSKSEDEKARIESSINTIIIK